MSADVNVEGDLSAGAANAAGPMKINAVVDLDDLSKLGMDWASSVAEVSVTEEPQAMARLYWLPI